MQNVQFDQETVYVQKLYFFIFGVTITLLLTLFASLFMGLKSGLVTFLGGLMISYTAMIKKKNFTPPEKKITAKRMARSISHDTSPLSIARFASQLYFYFHEPTQAISLLEKFLPSQDPLICVTLGEILIKENKAKHALYILRENPFALTNPLLLSTQGHILKHLNIIPEAVKMYEQSLLIAKQNGFPHNGAHWLTQKFITISYTATIHHSLADCYLTLENIPMAKFHYRAGNKYLFDISLWRHCQLPSICSAKYYSKSR